MICLQRGAHAFLYLYLHLWTSLRFLAFELLFHRLESCLRCVQSEWNMRKDVCTQPEASISVLQQPSPRELIIDPQMSKLCSRQMTNPILPSQQNPISSNFSALDMGIKKTHRIHAFTSFVNTWLIGLKVLVSRIKFSVCGLKQPY